MVEPLVTDITTDHVDFSLSWCIGAELSTRGPLCAWPSHTADTLRLLCRRLCALFALSIGQSALRRGLLVIRKWAGWLPSTHLNSCLLAGGNIKWLALLFSGAGLLQGVLRAP